VPSLSTIFFASQQVIRSWYQTTFKLQVTTYKNINKMWLNCCCSVILTF
jgi:hypothetical protein